MDGLVDVAVVGAGPGGIAAAITARDHGCSVICVDKASFPRDKTCGDGLTAGALRHLELLGLTRAEFLDVGVAQVHETVLISPSGRQVTLPMPTGDGLYAAVAARRDLDAALVALARRRGVDVRERCTVEDVTRREDHVVLRCGDGHTLPARYVIAADGHWSPVRRALEPDTPRDLGEWHAVRQYFADVNDDRLWVLFEPDLLPGYAWVFPLPHGGANVGYGVLRADGRTGRDLKELWATLLARPALRAVIGAAARPAEPMRAWPIPTRYDPQRLSDGRVLFVGDAAGVVDPMTGEGIAQALETGALAGDAVAAGGTPPAVGARYRRRVGLALGRDLRFASALQSLLRSSLATRAAIAAAGLTPWTRRNFARWMFEDYPRALLLTPDRWRRGAFSAAGAYRMT
ncbi:MAG TPA: geranylgeranyl reductase family protein [Acidimicrobiia bacterium]|nr:geranylgeranyl reductase family protein [Acidimicrobiia bacterium]